MEQTRPAPALQTREWLLDRYGPSMTHREVAESLKLKPETLRRKMWSNPDLPWVQALHEALCNYQGRDRVYRTTLVAQLIEGENPERTSGNNRPRAR